MAKIKAADAIFSVLSDWGVKRVYGLSGASLSPQGRSTIIDFIDISHEEVGALAAVAEAKLTNRIGVTFSYPGPGAAHLINGLYDAKADRVPMLALVDQLPTNRMNTGTFQDMPENPMFAEVAVFNHTATSAQNLPTLVDTAIRTAYAERGVAVVVVPADLGQELIDDDYLSTGETILRTSRASGIGQDLDAGPHATGFSSEPLDASPVLEPDLNPGVPPRPEDVRHTYDILSGAERPIIYFGRGARGAEDALVDIAHEFHVPLVSSYLGKGIVNLEEPAYTDTAGRLGTKPGNDAVRAADTVLYIGTNMEFGIFNPDALFIDVNARLADIGAHHPIIHGARADAPAFLRDLLCVIRDAKAEEERASAVTGDSVSAVGEEAFDRSRAPREHAGHRADVVAQEMARKREEWYEAVLEDKRQWVEWVDKRAAVDTAPMQIEPIFKRINDIASPDAIFGVDVGSINIYTSRYLRLHPRRRFVTSPLYGTLGIGMPTGIAAALSVPGREVWTLSGDGGATMIIQALTTMANLHLPIINVVFSDNALAFHDGDAANAGATVESSSEGGEVAKPEATVVTRGREGTDFAKLAEAFGVRGFTARTPSEFDDVLARVKGTTEPVLIDLKITRDMELPTRAFPLHATDREDFEEFRAAYRVEDLEPLDDIARRHGVGIDA